MRDFDKELTALVNRRNPDIWDQASKLEQIADDCAAELARLRAVNAELAAALGYAISYAEAMERNLNADNPRNVTLDSPRAALAKAKEVTP